MAVSLESRHREMDNLRRGGLPKVADATVVKGERRLAGSTGLEPAASAVTGQRSSQLNYDPKSETNRGFEKLRI